MANIFKACSVDGCNGNAGYTAGGKRDLCGKHYKKLRRHGDPTVVQRRRGLPPLPCSVEGCSRAASSKGLCKNHYERSRKYGDPVRVMPGNLTHGMSGTRLYGIWIGMRTRCGHVRGANAVAVRHYRDKGIRVCEAWQEFVVFAQWATANGYADDLTIDRIDSDQNYEPGNCRWVTMRDNLRARDDRKLNFAAAQEMRELARGGATLSAVAGRYGVSERTALDVLAGKSWVE